LYDELILNPDLTKIEWWKTIRIYDILQIYYKYIKKKLHFKKLLTFFEKKWILITN
jgi:hypothetical protein